MEPTLEDVIKDRLMYAYVRGWEDGRAGVRNDDEKRAVADEEIKGIILAIRVEFMACH